MAMADVSLAREQAVFVVVESTFGTLVVPSATDAVFVTEQMDHPGGPEFLDDEQIRDTATHTSQLKGRWNPGSWNLTMYNKPSTGATTAPEIDALLEGLFGASSTTASDRVRYTLGTSYNSYSIWRKIGHTVYQLAGCVVQQGVFRIAGNEFTTVQFSGQYARRYWAGSSTAQSAVSATDTTVTVGSGHAERFSTGSYIQLGTDTNSGSGYRITSINKSTDVLTFTPAAASGCSSGDTIRGYYPSSSTEVGDPIYGKLGQATLDSGSFAILSAVVTVNNNIKLYTDEKNNSLYVSEYGAPNRRRIMVEMEAYHYKDYTKFHDGVDNQTQYNIVIPSGDTVPYIHTWTIPRFELNADTVPTGDEEQVVTLSGYAVGTSTGDDEATLVYGKASDS